MGEPEHAAAADEAVEIAAQSVSAARVVEAGTEVRVAVAVLRTVARRIGAVHDAAWWSGSGAGPQAGVRQPGFRASTPQVGDPPSLHRYRELLTDLRVLEHEVRQVAPLPKDLDPVFVLSAPRAVYTRLRLLIGVLASIDGEPVDAQDVRAVVARVARIGKHVDAVLSTPRMPRVEVACRNPRGRDACTREVANAKRRLCRSCENHEDYRKRRRGV